MWLFLPIITIHYVSCVKIECIKNKTTLKMLLVDLKLSVETLKFTSAETGRIFTTVSGSCCWSTLLLISTVIFSDKTFKEWFVPPVVRYSREVIHLGWKNDNIILFRYEIAITKDICQALSPASS